MNDQQFDALNRLLCTSIAYDSIRHGTAKIDESVFEWHLSLEHDRGLVLVTYKNGGDWNNDRFVDEVDEALIDYLADEAHKLCLDTALTNTAALYNEKTQKKALEIHQSGDPVRFILKTYNALHVGDQDIGKGILIGTANQSVRNSKGIQSKLTGESGEGKSHAARSMVHLHPEDYVIFETLSDQALYYMQDELKPGMTIFSDDVRISEGLEDIIKRSTSNYQSETKRRIPVKQGGAWTTRILTIPPRINWLLTSVDDQGSEQLVNRQLGFGVDDSSKQDTDIIRFEKAKADTAVEDWPITADVLVCRELIRIIKEGGDGKQRIFSVRIPFANCIAWGDVKNRRNFPIFLDLIRGFAVLRFMQREVQNNCIIATVKDFEDAKRLYDARAGLQKLHITETEKLFLMTLLQAGGEASASEMMNQRHLSRSRVRQIARRLEVKLPRFHIEKRTESVGDGDSRTSTSRVYYCYDGQLKMDAYESVVSLSDDVDCYHRVLEEWSLSPIWSYSPVNTWLDDLTETRPTHHMQPEM